MSRATVVSLCNFEIGPEVKPGLHPSAYIIPAAGELPGVLYLDNAFHDIPQLNYKSIRVTIDAEEVAESIVQDYRIAQIATDAVSYPGVFWLPGFVKPDDVQEAAEKLYLEELVRYNETKKGPVPYNKYDKATEEHLNWCRRLVARADDVWSVHRQRRHISSTMINAARYMGVEREWMNIDFAEKAAKCPACKSLVETGAAICSNCNAILDKEKYESIQFAGR